LAERVTWNPSDVSFFMANALTPSGNSDDVTPPSRCDDA
jgi:hypothetical protein